MRTSISVTNFSWQSDKAMPVELSAIAQLADRSGVDSLFLADHLLQLEPGTDASDPMLDAYTTLGFLASQTSRIRLGAMVSPVMLRPPALLIKTVTTLDVLSRGRAWFGIGAGYHQQEASMLGLPFGPTTERYGWLEDTLKLAKQMWGGSDNSFTGRYVRAEQPISCPRPYSQPHPPILIGGAGEQKTLRLVARYGDACNLPDLPDGGKQLRHKLAVLAEHCRSEGRAFDQIEKTVSTRLGDGETPAEFVTRAQALGEIGIDHLVVLTKGPWMPESLGVLAECVAPINEIAVLAADRPL